jgi:peptide/nickel transport system substrate-binding protein
MGFQPRKYAALAAVVLAAAGGLAACGKSSGGGSASSSQSPGTPVSGGTLHIVAAGGPDHIDPVPAYTTYDYMLERAYARQLLSYKTIPSTSTTSAAWTESTTPAADVATVVPSTSNGGISADGLTYTFHLKSGVDWSTTPARQVTADDFIREFKAFCNPAPGGFVGNIVYYEATVSGLTSYCNAETKYFASKSHAPTAVNIANFQNSHTISGLSAPSALTLQVKLVQPASDFLNMMAMPFTSARPVEYDKYIPNSLQLDQHSISDGPYKITSYVPTKTITLARNSAWKQSTDQLRHQYVTSMVVTEGVPSAATQLQDMQAGTQDVPMDTQINPPSVPGLLASKAPNFGVYAWDNTIPYVVFNLRSPNAGGAMNKLLVRQAVEYGINKVAVQKVFGGPAVTKVLNSIIPPGNVGALTASTYPTPGSEGNENKCKADLKQAGYASGIKLNYLYQTDSVNTATFTAIQASLKLCGINLVGKAEPSSSFYTDLGNAPSNNKAGVWDMGQGAWIPDWFGNNGRTIIPPFFQTDCQVNTINYGCYSTPKMDNLIKGAEAAKTVSAAGALWGQANTLAMQQALMVPLQSENYPMFTSKRTHGPGVFSPTIGASDPTNLWISGS